MTTTSPATLPFRRPAPAHEPPHAPPSTPPAERSRTRQDLAQLRLELGFAERTGPVRLRLVDGDGPRRTGRSSLPDARAWATRLVQALLEVESGARPTSQLARWLREDVLLDVRRRRATSPPAARAGVRPLPGRLVRVHVGEPDDGVAEVAAVVAVHGRVRALALRLEGLDGRWVCTSYDRLLPGTSPETQQPAARGVRVAG
ncbi:hypothetical protein EV189_1911 [Motilibacter rhizosphaerae]|uniref:Uncharacterized protein n=1 Tax=Motilibacter rhizosphaerae TaxID=598652 RepID=A0A4Q7NTJ7_9ACTN|nr:Rv3235 family protein [Motilibacter rhizosphaerae]RZS90128.1 hypothetical protein EV189_1911 [Motilibacter rhizosphaerae]